ncbi:MAG: hypothetical protein KGH65_03255 [Candidatus Micrarchaeota archaeon]|nr:hypothetical protein [Candidatus Micrarchaeota archaeon]
MKQKINIEVMGDKPKLELMLRQSNIAESTDANLKAGFSDRVQKFGFSMEVHKNLEILWGYDFSKLTEKVISKNHPAQIKTEQLYPLEEIFGKVDEKLAKTLETEFRKFMSLIIVEPKASIAPARGVDMYWHLFILDTVEYRKFCDSLFGKFIDHIPSTDETREHTREAYQNTLSKYHRLFGDPESRVWGELKIGEDGNCGASSNPGCKSCGNGGSCGVGMERQ